MSSGINPSWITKVKFSLLVYLYYLNCLVSPYFDTNIFQNKPTTLASMLSHSTGEEGEKKWKIECCLLFETLATLKFRRYLKIRMVKSKTAYGKLTAL